MSRAQFLTIRLLSDTTFAAGGGTAGEVDIEIDHDEFGLPRIRAKRIRSLLRDTWLSMAHCFDLEAAAVRVFGPPGDVDDRSILRFGTAELQPDVREWVRHAVTRELHPIEPLDILRTLTVIRAQTSEDRANGAPESGSLRSIRVARHGLLFFAQLDWLVPDPSPADLKCIALAVLGTRHAGLARNRGRGRLEILLHEALEKNEDDLITQGRQWTRAKAEVAP